MNIIETHLEKILSNYTTGSYYEDLKTALQVYTDLTGQMNEDSNEYETRMNNFNDWFIFNYQEQKIYFQMSEAKRLLHLLLHYIKNHMA